MYLVFLCGCGSRSELPGGTREAGTTDAATDRPLDAPIDQIITHDAPFDAPIADCVDGFPTAPWVWSSSGSSGEYVKQVTIGNDGSVYAVGTFSGTVDFDPGPSVEEHTANDRTDVFVTKLGCDGRHVWTRTWGGTDHPVASSGWGDEGESIALTPDGSIIVSGQFCSAVDFDAGPGELVLTSQACFDGFVLSLTNDGATQWAHGFGGSGRDRVGGVAIAPDGSIYLAGQFENGVDFDSGPSQALATSNGEIDEFVLKLTSAGEFVWVRTWGGPATEYGTGHLVARGDGSVVVAGQFQGEVDFDPGPGIDLVKSAGGDDVFVVAFDSVGQRLFAKTFGSLADQNVSGIALGNDDALYLTGSFYGSTDFDPGPEYDTITNAGYYDAYLTRLEKTGAYAWTRTWGGQWGAYGIHLAGGLSVATSFAAGLIVVGSFQGTVDFDPGEKIDLRSSATLDQYDAFAIVFEENGNATQWWTWGGAGFDGAYAASRHAGRPVVAGAFEEQVEFAPPPFGGGLVKASNGGQGAFVVHW